VNSYLTSTSCIFMVTVVTISSSHDVMGSPFASCCKIHSGACETTPVTSMSMMHDAHCQGKPFNAATQSKHMSQYVINTASITTTCTIVKVSQVHTFVGHFSCHQHPPAC
jgi:hypothetical protein